MEWKEVLLSEFLEFNPKRTIKKNEVARKITMDLLIPHSKQIYSFKYEPYTGGAKFSNGDTIMARITPCLENGKHAYVSCLNEGEIAYGSTEYIVLCGKNGVSDNEFVYYLSHTPQFVNTAIKSMVGSSGRQRAQVPVLENLIMPVPVNLSDQRKIAGILSALDAKIENNNKINANLEAQAQALFKSWFVDFTPFKDQPFVDSELGPIPQGWKVEKINDLDLYITDFVSNGSFASLKQNVTLYSDENYAFFIRNTDLKEGRFRAYVDKSSYFFLKKSVLHGGEIIISNVGDVGSVNLCPKLNKPMTLGNNIIMLKSEDEATHNFLYILFKWSYGKSLIKSITGGSAQPKFNKGDFKSLKIIMPTGKKISDFNLIASSLLKKIEEFKEENQRLAALRDTLLPKLMSGEIKL